MRVLGKRSLSSFLKVLTDIGFWGTLLAGTLLIAVAILSSFMQDSSQTSINLPVSFQLDPDAYEIAPDQEDATADITEAEGTINVHGVGNRMFLTPVLLLLPVLAAMALVLHRLRRVFRRLVQNRPFAPENAKDLRFIGLVVILGELTLAAFSYLSSQFLIDQVTSTGVALNANFDVRMPVILAGVVLFIVAEIFREGAVMKADMEAAREIQFSLVADTEYETGPVSINALMRPADSVGGDYYDVIELGEDRIAFVLADVAGHGLPAALLMTLLQGSLRSLIGSGFRGAELVSKVNSYLVANTPGNRMVTFFYGELDPATGELTYVNAGHNPPYLVNGAGLERLASTSVILGSFDGAPFKEADAVLSEGSRVVLFTDGITEAANTAGEEFGEERLEELLGADGAGEAAEFIDGAFKAVLGFSGKAPQADDMTMMVVGRS